MTNAQSIGKQKEKRASRREQAIQVPARWVDAEARDIVFANQIFVRYTGSAYIITFGQSHGPYELHLSKEQLQREGVPIRAVARIAVTPENLGQFLSAMRGLYERRSGGKGVK